ncbi:MAG TPA: AAA family ATPase [Candidatus Saccharimonadales bacterium]|jgi:replication-associated recombination protein RarA|nr:AAA family ATPase [Candidatus Saccharimonadales bacterium]
MKGLLLQPITEGQVENFIKSPSHALMLVGSRGSGKGSLSRGLAELILEVSSLNDYPYKLIIEPDNGKSIGIEPIRQLEHFFSLKVPRTAAYQRVVIIEEAHKLTLEAQNALLKTLEEPPSGTLMILNSNYEQALQPTIRSRTQIINVKSPDQTALTEFFKERGFSETKINQVYAISGGLLGLMQALLEDADHPLLKATDQARRLLASSTYERLIMVDELSKQPELASDTIFILQQMAHVSLQKAGDQSARRWQAILKAGFQASTDLASNAQPKLALTNLCLSF